MAMLAAKQELNAQNRDETLRNELSATCSQAVAEQMVLLIRRVHSSIRSQAEITLKLQGLTFVQWLALRKLWRRSDLTVATLADELHTDPALLVRAIHRLEHRGLLLRTRSHVDRRRVHLELSDGGGRLAAQLHGLLKDAVAMHLVDFSEPDHQELQSLLLRMLDNGERQKAAQTSEILQTL